MEKAITVFLCFIVAMLNTLSTAYAQPAPTLSYTPIGQIIDIGGWRLHLFGRGLQNSKGPTVIFENGIRGFSFDWLPVQEQVTSFAKCYTYDRAGYAWSELGPRPHTMRQTVHNLHTLLKRAGVPPPYLLVGASYGGLLVRLFAQQYPQEVAGIVLVDAAFEDGIQYINGKRLRPSTDVTDKLIPEVKKTASVDDNRLARSPEAVKAIGEALKTMGYPFTKVEPPFDQQPDSLQALRLWALSQFEFYVANDNPFHLEEKALMIKEREKNPAMLGTIPLVVLTAGLAGNPETDPEEKERRLNQTAMTNLSRNSKQVIVNSGHHIHIEQPDLVVDAIRQVVEAINKKEKLKK